MHPYKSLIWLMILLYSLKRPIALQSIVITLQDQLIVFQYPAKWKSYLLKIPAKIQAVTIVELSMTQVGKVNGEAAKLDTRPSR